MTMMGVWGDEDVFGCDVVLAIQEGREREIHVYRLCARKFELLRIGLNVGNKPAKNAQ